MKRVRGFLACVLLAGGLAAQPAAPPASNPCPAGARFGDPAAGPSWNGWGVDASNARFQPEKAAQLTAAQVPKLKLKWAFGFPGVRSVLGAPVVSGRCGRAQRHHH